MKIAIITGSPHRKGTSALLADRFIEGAVSAGHEIFRFDAAFEDVAPCNGCDACGIGSRPCVHRDAFEKLAPHIIEADAVVFVTPLYYFGMSAQLKTVIDRFYGINSRIQGTGKQAVLLATSWNDDSWTMTDLESHYKTIVKYLGWCDAGTVLAIGCGTRAMIERSIWPQRAYELGRSIG